MVTIIIMVIIGLLIGIWVTYTDSWNRDEWEMYVVHCIFGMIVCGMVGLFIAWALPMDTKVNHSVLKLENLQDNSSVDGKFYLGCGNFGSDMKYVFYTEENGMYKMMQLDVDDCLIRYSDDKPIVHVFEIYPTDAKINFFAYDGDVFNKSYVIEVPRGTIDNNYNLDAR